MPSIKQLQDAVANATAAKLAAQSAYNNANNAMISYYNAYMVNCKYKWAIPNVGQVWSQEGCDGSVNANQHPGCGSQATCKSRVVEYNGLVSTTNTRASDLNTANTNLTTAQTALNNYTATDPDVLATENKNKNYRLLLIVGIALVVLAGVFFLVKKFIKK